MAKEIAGKNSEQWQKRLDEDWDVYFKRTSKQLADLMVESNKVDVERGSIVNLIVTFPIADGRAYYKVVKDSPLVLEHIPFSDAWHISPAHMRGLRKVDVIRDTLAHRKWANILNKTRG